MNYQESIAYIHQTPKFSRVLGNDMLRRLLSFLDNPHRNMKYIHIAGTNGKGSTAAFTANMLEQAGYTVGLFTSPYIEVYNERIRVNGEPIPDLVLADLATRVRDCMEKNDAYVSEFAFAVAMAFLYFKQCECDYIVLETGMGGTLDGSNVIETAELTVLTSISLDHTQYLGSTIEEITAEKCGIIKQGVPVICYCMQNQAAETVIKNVCREKHAQFIKSDIPQITADGFLYQNNFYQIGLKGTYQPYNAALAVEIIHQLVRRGAAVPETAVCEGLKQTRWAARFEFIRRNLILDGSHNPDGIRTLCDSLKALGKRIILVVAMMEDKDYTQCVRMLSQIADLAVITQIDMPRCAKAETLEKIMMPSTKTYVKKQPGQAVLHALSLCGEDAVVCVCGSLYLAGEIRREFV